ncbi:unnamed protein product [Prunus armeniaca]
MLNGVIGFATQSKATADGGDRIDMALSDARFYIMIVELVKTGVIAAELMMVRVFAAFPIVEGALVAVLPFRVLGILSVRGRRVMVGFGGGRLKRIDVGQKVFLTHVEGEAKQLNILFLTIVEDTLGKGAKAWLRPKGLVVAMLLVLETSNLLKNKSHGMIDMREGRAPKTYVVGWAEVDKFPIPQKLHNGKAPSPPDGVVKVYRNRDGLWPKLRDLVPAVPMDLGRGIRPMLWLGDLEKSRLSHFRMKMDLAFVRPRLVEAL